MNDYPEKIILAGGYATRLTCAEQNAWNELCLNLEPHRVLERAKAHASMLVIAGDPGDMLDAATDEVAHATLIMFYAARNWAIENVGSEAKACRDQTPEEIEAGIKEMVDKASGRSEA